MSGINEDKKLTYEAPKVLKLGELAVGQKCGPGTNPDGVCSDGSIGGGACQPFGSGPEGTCNVGPDIT